MSRYAPPSWLGTLAIVGLLVLLAVTVVADIFVEGYMVPRELFVIAAAVLGPAVGIKIWLGGGGPK